jgi:hypothetical protein
MGRTRSVPNRRLKIRMERNPYLSTKNFKADIGDLVSTTTFIR